MNKDEVADEGDSDEAQLQGGQNLLDTIRQMDKKQKAKTHKKSPKEQLAKQERRRKSLAKFMASSDELIAAAVSPKNSVLKTGNIVLDRINEEVERQRVVSVIPPFHLPIIEDQEEEYPVAEEKEKAEDEVKEEVKEEETKEEQEEKKEVDQAQDEDADAEDSKKIEQSESQKVIDLEVDDVDKTVDSGAKKSENVETFGEAADAVKVEIDKNKGEEAELKKANEPAEEEQNI